MVELKNRLGTSIELGILQILVGLVISIPIGVISAVRQDTWLDYVLRFFAVLGLAVPSFYMALRLAIIASPTCAAGSPPGYCRGQTSQDRDCHHR